MTRASIIVACSVIALAGLAPAQDDSAGGTLTASRAASYFAELKRACATNDPGDGLWGVEIYGPVLLVDAATRHVVANQADEEGLLTERDGVYVGTLPPDQPLGNAPVTWAGVRWAMVLTMFLPETDLGRLTILAHESFHRVQLGMGLFAFGRENNHLDTPDGRYWMKLEWNALQAALGVEGDARHASVRDALAFRAARRNQFPDAAPRENAVEIREGLAQYTGLRIAGATRADVVADVKNRRSREDGIVRSFGYNSGALYGFLLDAADTSWRDGLTRQSDLGAMLAAASTIEPDPAHADTRATKYDGPAIRIAEADRDRERQARLAEFRALLIDGPVLILDLSLVEIGTMDTRAVHPLAEGKIVFTVRKLIAEWGTLTVNGGALLEDRTISKGRLSLRNAVADHLSGDGWALQLNEGWTVASGERTGDCVISKKPHR